MQALSAAPAVFTVGAVVAIVTGFAERAADTVLAICAVKAGLVAAWAKKLFTKFGQRGLKLLNIHAANILALPAAPSPSNASCAYTCKRMCGRMTLTNADWAEVAEELSAAVAPEVLGQLRPRFNVAPTQLHPVIANTGNGNASLCMATWGFSTRRQGSLVINARAETACFSPLFREAFANRRCVAVVDGFLEWRTTSIGRQPVWFQRKGKGLLYLAGLLREPTTPGESPEFVVLTTAANILVASIHNRMPAVLAPQDACTWLTKPAVEILRPAPEDYLTAMDVSSRVNNAAHDDPGCIAPKSDTREQLSLF